MISHETYVVGTWVVVDELNTMTELTQEQKIVTLVVNRSVKQRMR